MSGEEMRLTLGFASFGRRKKQKASVRVETLAQLLPGTELTTQQEKFATANMEIGLHGVLYLLCQEKKEDSLLTFTLETEEKVKEMDQVPYTALLQELEREKLKFETLDQSQFLCARAATNEYETLGRHHFVNRSAMKLVTLDYIFQLTLKDTSGECFTFADICGGPGGFTEYLLWRNEQESGNLSESGGSQSIQGFGITLKDAANNCDWRLPSKFRHLFEICYGEDGTGNLYSIRNIHNFRDLVKGQFLNGVDLVVADGGFLDARSQSNQELMMTKLILAEILAMFAVLRTGGDFVCKTFELATSAMQQLCWLLHQCFQRFAIVKPITSRPASSERYIVARGLQSGHPTSKLVKILENQLVKSDNTDNFKFQFLKNTTVMYQDVNFLQYMTTANEAITRSQIEACRRINEFAANNRKRKLRDADRTVDRQLYYNCWKLDKVSRHKFAK